MRITTEPPKSRNAYQKVQDEVGRKYRPNPSIMTKLPEPPHAQNTNNHRNERTEHPALLYMTLYSIHQGRKLDTDQNAHTHNGPNSIGRY